MSGPRSAAASYTALAVAGDTATVSADDGAGGVDDDTSAPPTQPVPNDGPDEAEPVGWIRPYWRLLRTNREYRVLFLGNVMSGLGDWFNIIASLSVLNEADGSALALAFYTAINALPALLLGPFIGIVADKYSKKQLMILSMVGRALTAFGLIFCQTPETLAVMYVLTFLKYSFTALYQPSRTAVVPAVVTKAELVLANGLDGIVWSCMLFVGGASGGFATSLFGITTSFVLDGLAYLIAAYVLGFLLAPSSPWTPFRLLAGWATQVARRTTARAGHGRYVRMAGDTALAPVQLDDDGADAVTDASLALRVNNEDYDDTTSVVELVAAASGSPSPPPEADAESVDAVPALEGTQPHTGLRRRSTGDVVSEEDEGATPEADDKLGMKVAPTAPPTRPKSPWRMVADGFVYMWRFRYVFAICFYKGSLNLVRQPLVGCRARAKCTLIHIHCLAAVLPRV